MSSYVINKREYVKAGGFVAGVAAELQLWNYDLERGRNMTKEDYYEKFVKFYDMNAESVQEQYGDSERENDPCEYKDKDSAKYVLRQVMNCITKSREFFFMPDYDGERSMDDV